MSEDVFMYYFVKIFNDTTYVVIGEDACYEFIVGADLHPHEYRVDVFKDYELGIRLCAVPSCVII